jgi:hypothetical protein
LNHRPSFHSLDERAADLSPIHHKLRRQQLPDELDVNEEDLPWSAVQAR